jgi:hypothetical protein
MLWRDTHKNLIFGTVTNKPTSLKLCLCHNICYLLEISEITGLGYNTKSSFETPLLPWRLEITRHLLLCEALREQVGKPAQRSGLAIQVKSACAD